MKQTPERLSSRDDFLHCQTSNIKVYVYDENDNLVSEGNITDCPETNEQIFVENVGYDRNRYRLSTLKL